MGRKRNGTSVAPAANSDSAVSSKRQRRGRKLNSQGEDTYETKSVIVSDSDVLNGIVRHEIHDPDNGEVKEDRKDADVKSKEVCDTACGDDEDISARFIGEPIPDQEARRRWPHRYQQKRKDLPAGSKKSKEENDDEITLARRHYTRAVVDEREIYELYDDAHVHAGDGQEPYICKIVEMFEALDGSFHFTAKWFYRACDTVIQKHGTLIDDKRVFISEIQNDNPLDCLIKKLKISMLQLNADLETRNAEAATSDYFCDMRYLLPCSTFIALPTDTKIAVSDNSSTISSDSCTNGMAIAKSDQDKASNVQQYQRSETTLLDLYSGCGAMSTGLCLGAELSGLNLVTRWAVDLNKHACDSLKYNHPETQVRNESADDFLLLIKEWRKLCVHFSLIEGNDQEQYRGLYGMDDSEDNDDEDEDENDENSESEVFEVEKILQICYGDPKQNRKCGLHLKVRWKNYGPEHDTWEPIEGLSGCRERIKEFVQRGHKSRILPLPGDADVVCGGPPCQGISGFNRFRNKNNPLADEKNKQLLVYMDIVEHLKPKYILMENVVDILKFSDGYLGRYAAGRLIQMNYQTRMGMMAAGAYGLPQFRMRFFLWGSQPNQKLPQFPLPTHDVVVRGVIPVEFERNTVAYDEGKLVKLESKLLLKDAISDLPAVGNDEKRDEIPYDKDPETPFQKMIRLRRADVFGSSEKGKKSKYLLYDHHPLNLNSDDYQRVCQIPKRKGANFRNLPGVRVTSNNTVEWDPNVKRVYLDSGKPLVPDYAMSFVDGKSSKPFGRLWWDETVPTVITRAEPHNHALLHPEQDRVLTIRENARLQGFPDYYKLFGPPKEKYIQVGNAVAVPVAQALGYALGQAFQGASGDEPLFTLPEGYPNLRERASSESSEESAR